jgi:hypothetical protein
MRRPRKTLDQRIQEGQKPSRATKNNLDATRRKLVRLKSRVQEIVSGPYCYFITLTIAPEYYGKDPEYYIQTIKKVLHNVSEQYILNEDYGDKTERLHFHALVTTHEPIITEFIKGDNYWKDCPYLYGQVHVKPFDNRVSSKDKVKEYILKTENHAIKSTAGRIFYSRRKKTHEKTY